MGEATFEEIQSEGVFDDRFGREGVTDEEIAQVRIERGPHFFAVVSLDSTLSPAFTSHHYLSISFFLFCVAGKYIYKACRPQLAEGKGW
jgi:hypothetical protein